MAASRHDDADGSDIFWPGYVDATTNLILNLLFLLTILIVAVFMFALELGRSSKLVGEKAKVEATTQAQPLVAEQDTAALKENEALKREVERLSQLLAAEKSRAVEVPAVKETVYATVSPPDPLQGLNRVLPNDFEIIVRFTDEAVDFSQSEKKQLLKSLLPLSEHGEARITVDVPVGFSESKRLGFYRAMAVRNLLIELNVPKEKIEVSVAESKGSADASMVRVRPN
ncbi:MAG: hypothetical protein C0614_10675 [Desulfuromonas sp.]|nr:MAG: hypothetical protein C0614_10675 [Desulfuromonas sp.]